MFSCPNTYRTEQLAETVQRRFTTNSIMVMGVSEWKFNLLSNLSVRTTRSCHCPRHLNLGRFGLFVSRSFWPQRIAQCPHPPCCLEA